MATHRRGPRRSAGTARAFDQRVDHVLEYLRISTTLEFALMPTAPPRELGDELVRIVKLMSAARAQAPALRDDIDPGTYSVMFLIWRGETRMSDLATRLHADISTMSRQVSALTDKGLIERRPDPHDGRAQVLALTGAGKDFVMALRARRDAWLSDVLAAWTPQERAELTACLRRLADDVEADLAARPQPPQ